MSIIDRLKAKAQNVQGRHSAVELDEAEKRLDFPLPDLLRQVYMEVGYGWPFSTPFGLFSVWRASDEYRKARADAERGMPPYPEKLLPICEWGCGISSAIDCSHSDGPIVRIDPNLDVPSMVNCFDLSPDFKFYGQYSNAETASWYEAGSLNEWLEGWLTGVDLFRQPYPAKKAKVRYE